MKDTEVYFDLLKNLIRTPSLSKEEDKTADILENFLKEKGYSPQRIKNNIFIKDRFFDKNKATILLNSHHDTVKANEKWTIPPFEALEKEGKLFGLGSNDAGASLIALLAVFMALENRERSYNLIWAASAEEEISGKNGVELLLKSLGKIDFGVVGEPTEMQMAVAEKGLMVLDAEAQGKAGHAARNEGENAIYKALKDIEWFKNFQFEKVSDFLGEVKMTVTQIEAGYQHNVVPDICSFVVDVRGNGLYSNQEILQIIQENTISKITARSTRLNSSEIDLSHPFLKKGITLGLETYGSPTLSDQALMSFPTVKIGVGDSARSHTADEFVYKKEFEEGIEIYLKLLKGLEL